MGALFLSSVAVSVGKCRQSQQTHAPFALAFFFFSPLTAPTKLVKAARKSVVVKAAKKPVVVSPNKAANEASLNRAQDKILQTMGQLRAIGLYQPKKDQLMSFSGNAKTPEGYKKNVGILRKQEFLLYPTTDTVELTKKGVVYVGDGIDASTLSNAKFHENVKSMLTNKGALIFDKLADGSVRDKLQTARELGYDLTKLSGYEKDLSKMSSLGFLTKTKTTIQLTDKCFPLGHPTTSDDV